MQFGDRLVALHKSWWRGNVNEICVGPKRNVWLQQKGSITIWTSSELGQHFVWVAASISAMGQQLLPLLYGCRRLWLCVPQACAMSLMTIHFLFANHKKIEVQLIFDLLGGSTCRTTCKLILFEKCQNNFIHTIVCKKLTIKLYFG